MTDITVLIARAYNSTQERWHFDADCHHVRGSAHPTYLRLAKKRGLTLCKDCSGEYDRADIDAQEGRALNNLLHEISGTPRVEGHAPVGQGKGGGD